MSRKVWIWGDIAFYLAVLIAAVILRPRTRVQVAAIAVAAVAFPLWIAARVQLGSALSFWPEARTLVTSGLYARIRHPVYLFGTVASLERPSARGTGDTKKRRGSEQHGVRLRYVALSVGEERRSS